MHGFWSIWCFFIIRCSWNGRLTKLVELVSNKHISSISWIKYRYVGSKYMHFMTANSYCCADRLWWCKVVAGMMMWKRRTWSTTSSKLMCDYVGPLLWLFFHCFACLVVTIHDLLLVSFLVWHDRSSASIAYPYPYNGIRAVLHSLRSRSCTYMWYVMDLFLHGLIRSIGVEVNHIMWLND
jgi:hypothetical protein